MKPVRQDLEIYKGETWEQSFKFSRKVGQIKQPIDLSGYTVKSQIRPADNSPILTAEFTVSREDAEGLVYIALTSEQTASLPVGIQAWDLKLIDTNNVTNYWIKGQVVISGRVTE